MRPFTSEAAEQVISLLCYSRTDDRYHYGPRGKPTTCAGAFRLAVTVKEGSPPQLVLSDIYDPAMYRTITVADAVQQGLLDPSWEDFATKLYLNDQDILYMCLMSRIEPVPLRLNDVARVKSFVLDSTRSASSRPPFTSNESIPPKSLICRAATSWRGCVASPG